MVPERKIDGWIGNLFLVVGSLLIGEHTRYSFLLIFIGELIWSIKVYKMKEWDMFFICVVFGLIALRNFVIW